MIIILFFMLLVCQSAWAAVDTEQYLVSKPDGSVSVISYVPGSDKSLPEVISDLGYTGYVIKPISFTDIPKSRKDRKYWKANNGKIDIDTTKKQADIDAAVAVKAKKDAVLQKLKITEAEWNDVAK